MRTLREGHAQLSSWLARRAHATTDTATNRSTNSKANTKANTKANIQTDTTSNTSPTDPRTPGTKTVSQYYMSGYI